MAGSLHTGMAASCRMLAGGPSASGTRSTVPWLIDEGSEQIPDSCECVGDGMPLCICEAALLFNLPDVLQERANRAQGKMTRRTPLPTAQGARRSEAIVRSVIAGDVLMAGHVTIHDTTAQLGALLCTANAGCGVRLPQNQLPWI